MPHYQACRSAAVRGEQYPELMELFLFAVLTLLGVSAVIYWMVRTLREQPPQSRPTTPRQPQAPKQSRTIAARNLSHLPEQQAGRTGAGGHRSRYLHSSRFDELLDVDRQPPPLHLVDMAGEWWLAEDTTGLFVTAANRHVRRYNIFGFNVRGWDHHREQMRAANLAPGTPVRLVPEPENPYDKNAIAVYGGNGAGPVGYVNRALASTLAKRLAAGEPLEAISIRGERARSLSDGPKTILVATPELIAHLRRKLR